MVKLEQSGDMTIRHEIVFPQASSLAQLIAQAAVALTGVSVGQVFTALTQLSQEVATMTENLGTDITRLQADVQAETAETANVKTALDNLRAQIPDPGTVVSASQADALHAALDALEQQTQLQGQLTNPTPTPPPAPAPGV